MIGIVNAETISLNIVVNPYEITKDQAGYDRVAIAGYRLGGLPGDPMLPSKVFNVLVPPDIVWDTLKLAVGNVETEILSGSYQIRPAAPDAAYVDGRMIQDWGPNENVIDGKNSAVYGIAEFFPAKYAELLPYSQMRKWKYARVSFTPMQYNAGAGQLKRIKTIRMDLSFQQSGDRSSSAILNDKVMDGLAPEFFFNYNQGKDWYAVPDRSKGMIEDPATSYEGGGSMKRNDLPGVTYDYVIITTNAIVSASSKLSSFISHKQSREHSVLVVTETDFDGLTGQSPNHRAEKIRQWLKNNYVSYGIEYVLLIGDPHPYESGEGDIPMKMCWPKRGAESSEDSPTDAFYADLTGNWDIDGDGYYGEWSDYTSPGGVDFSMEVWVGRIPVYSADYTTLDNVLQKTIDYESESDIHWRDSILLPMSFSKETYDGAPLAEQMMHDYLNSRSYASWTQYQQGNGACGLNSAYSSDQELRGGTIVRDRWAAQDYGVVCWWGHGSATSASVGCDDCWDGTLFSDAQTASLDDNHPSFTFQCSCNNGYPEDANNLAYSILKQGGIGTVSASRISYFNDNVGYGDFDGSSTNSGIGYEYVKRLTQPLAAGNALYQGKLAVVGDIGRQSRLANQYDFNLYGDPAVGLDSSGCPDCPANGIITNAIYPLSKTCSCSNDTSITLNNVTVEGNVTFIAPSVSGAVTIENQATITIYTKTVRLGSGFHAKSGSTVNIRPQTYTNSLDMNFVRLPAGAFTMGSPGDELGRESDEGPQHGVTLTEAFYMQTTEVTQAQWEAVMGNNPSTFKGCADCPVEHVSWDDVQDFITAINTLGEGGTYGLPTEAQWEYAARAGSTTAFYNGGITETLCVDDPNLDIIGWYCYNASGGTYGTRSVARKMCNAWGLYDMSGNVSEWCQDWYGSNYYSSSPSVNPTGPESGSHRVKRGGAWYSNARVCRSAERNYSRPDLRYYMGFRLLWQP